MNKRSSKKSNVRAFSTRKYPTFGRGAYNELAPPKTVVESPFYWWFMFLQLNEDYKALYEGRQSPLPKELADDFGNVFNADFKIWWNNHVDLFAEPITDYKMSIADSEDELAPFNDDEVINLVVPLNWSNVGIKRRFAQIIDKLVPKTPKGVRVKKSEANYKLGRKWNISALKLAYTIYQLKKENELAVLGGGRKLAWADIAIRAKLRTVRNLKEGVRGSKTSDARRIATILAMRHYKRATKFIEAAASRSFP